MRASLLPSALLSAFLWVSLLWAAEEPAPAVSSTFVISAPTPAVSAAPAEPAQVVAPASESPASSAAPTAPVVPPVSADPAGTTVPAFSAGEAPRPANATAPSAGETVEPAKPFDLPAREEEIPNRYCLGVYRDVPVPDDLERVRLTVLEAARAWRFPVVQLAWYAPGKKPGQGVAILASTHDGATVDIRRAENEAKSLDLEKRLAFPISPAEIADIYLQNEVVADDDFKGRPVIFESEVADIARGAFGKPYVFFPAHPGGVTGLTCYFDAKDPALRRLRKGSKVTVRAEVKGFLMQDVILEKCVVVEIH